MAKLIGATKSLCALQTFTEIFAPLSWSIMLKNEEIRQKYSFFRKGLNYFEAESITRGYICTVCKEEWKDYCDCGHWVPKTFFSQRNQVAYHFIAACQGCFNCTQLQIHTPSTSQLLFWNVFFWKFFERILSTLRHLLAFIEQVQNIDKSNASFVEVASCFATEKARIQERQSNVHIKPS